LRDRLPDRCEVFDRWVVGVREISWRETPDLVVRCCEIPGLLIWF
jgi:hypothetical protein